MFIWIILFVGFSLYAVAQYGKRQAIEKRRAAMANLSLSELKRLTPPHSSAAEEEEAFRYWSQQTMQAKLQATVRLTYEHYRELGVDVDKPMEKTLVRRIAPWAVADGDR